MEEKTESIPQYPECILPHPTYLDSIKEDELCSKSNGLIIQRRCPDNVSLEMICPEVFGNNLAEMSVNLLGGKFQPDFVKFTPKGVKPLSSLIPFEGNYTYSPDAYGVYISIFDINDRTFPSTRKFPNQQEYEKMKDAIKSNKERLVAAFSKKKGFSKEEDYELQYKIQVMHRPTNANYWHCQIEIAPAFEGAQTISKDKAEWQKNALRALTSFLVMYTSFDHPQPIPRVKSEWYIKETA